MVTFSSQELYNLGFPGRLKHHKGNILTWFHFSIHRIFIKFPLSRKAIGINTYKHIHFMRDWCFEAYVVLPFPTLWSLLATVIKFSQRWWTQLALWFQSRIFLFKFPFWFYHQSASISERRAHSIHNEKVFAVKEKPKKKMVLYIT